MPMREKAASDYESKGGERAAPSDVPRYSSTIMVPSITQLCWGSGQTMIDEIFILKCMK